jgi:hypothetical protein
LDKTDILLKKIIKIENNKNLLVNIRNRKRKCLPLANANAEGQL